MKLISMTDFVLKEQKQCNNDASNYGRGSLILIWNYANFLKQPLTLGMFVPCDLEGNVLEEPECSLRKECASPPCRQYQEAKDRVLFEGFIQSGGNHVKIRTKFIGLGFVNGIYKTVEDLIKFEAKLTPTAKIQIGNE